MREQGHRALAVGEFGAGREVERQRQRVAHGIRVAEVEVAGPHEAQAGALRQHLPDGHRTVLGVGLGHVLADWIVEIQVTELRRAAGEQRDHALGRAPDGVRNAAGERIERAGAGEAAVAVDADRHRVGEIGVARRFGDGGGIEVQRLGVPGLEFTAAGGQGAFQRCSAAGGGVGRQVTGQIAAAAGADCQRKRAQRRQPPLGDTHGGLSSL